jgi:PAS domain S-box-containing protein
MKEKFRRWKGKWAMPVRAVVGQEATPRGPKRDVPSNKVVPGAIGKSQRQACFPLHSGSMGSNSSQGFLVRRLWRDLPLVAKGIVALGFPIVVLTFGLNLYHQDVEKEAEAERWVAHSEVVRSDLRDLLISLLGMESAARGYAISLRPEMKHRFGEEKKDALRRLDEIERQVADNPLQLARASELRPIILTKIKRMEALLESGGGRPLTESDGTFDSSDAAMKAARAAVEQIDREEDQLQRLRLSRSKQDHDQSIKIVGITISIALLSIVGSLLLFIAFIRRRMKQLQIAARALRTEMPLVTSEKDKDEIGQLQAELERTSEIIAGRTRELRASEAQLRTIVDNTTAIVYIKDLESRFVLVNAQYERAFGFKSGQIIGRSPVELFGKEIGSALRANDLQVIQSRKPAQFEEQMVRNGKILTYISVKVPLLDEAGEPYGLCGISTDISSRKEASHEVQRRWHQPVLPSERLWR